MRTVILVSLNVLIPESGCCLLFTVSQVLEIGNDSLFSTRLVILEVHPVGGVTIVDWVDHVGRRNSLLN